MTKILHLKDRIIDLFTTSIFKMTNSDIINDECSGFSFHKIIKKKNQEAHKSWALSVI